MSAENLPCVYAVKVPGKEEGGGGMKKFRGPEKDEVTSELVNKFFVDFCKFALNQDLVHFLSVPD